MIKILIVDDHPVVRAGLNGMLVSQSDFEIVGEAATGAEALAQVEQSQPHVVLMDLRMPDMDGADATAHIRTKFSNVYVLILTTYDSDADILRAVEAGATGYLLKDAPRDDLFRAIRSAAQGESALAPTIASRLFQRVRHPTPTTSMLSARELEVLNWVAKGLSNKDIARRLHISEATVKSHLIHVFSKLQVDDRTAAVTLALEKGWLKLNS